MKTLKEATLEDIYGELHRRGHTVRIVGMHRRPVDLGTGFSKPTTGVAVDFFIEDPQAELPRKG